MKYILTALVAAFALSACCSTKCDVPPGGKAVKGDSCCATKKDDCCKKM